MALMMDVQCCTGVQQAVSVLCTGNSDANALHSLSDAPHVSMSSMVHIPMDR